MVTTVIDGEASVNAEPSIANSSKKALSDTQSSDQTLATNTDKDNETADVDLSLVNAQPQMTGVSVPAQNQLQPQHAAGAETEQAPILASAGSIGLPKSTLVQSQSMAAPLSDAASETGSPDLLTSLMASDKAAIKTDAIAAPKVNATQESVPAQPQVTDSKLTFEKTLQNLTHPDSSTREENASLPASTPTGPSSSGSAGALDSMLRFSDAQTPAARSFVVQTAVPVPVGQPQWSQAVGEKVLWLAAQNVSAAEIHLNPENLGPVQVKVSVNQEQTTVNFTSHHAAVREVLDQNLGRLRDMFSEQGLNLVNVDVSDKSFSRQQGDAKDQKGHANSNDPQVEDEAPVAISLIKQQRLVDHYA
ncbi:MAG: flagellar hook-length control protein FliK [Moraxellaceae bacterium]|nr:MAG: flagellar hook-length control protein FliK [Moraxellaceae bacterium]